MTLESATRQLRQRSRVTRRGARARQLASTGAPDVVEVGELFTAEMRIVCPEIGNATGCSFGPVTISGNGEEFYRDDTVSLLPGQDTTRRVGITFDEPGTYTIQFRAGNDARREDVEVVEPGAGDGGGGGPTEPPEIVDASVPGELQVGETFTADMTVECSAAGGCADVSLAIEADGETLSEDSSVQLGSGQSTTRRGGHTFNEPGTYTIEFSLGDQTVTRSVNVSPPPAPQIVGFDAPEEVQVGELFTASISVACGAGDGCADVPVSISSNGQEIVSDPTVQLGPGQETTRTGGARFQDPGTYELQFRAGDRIETSTVQVVEPPAPTIASIEAPDEVQVGELTTLGITVECGADGDCANVPVTISGQGQTVVDDQDVQLNSGQSTTRRGGATFDSPGTVGIQFRAGDQVESAQVDVVEPSGPVITDFSAPDQVTAGELFTASITVACESDATCADVPISISTGDQVLTEDSTVVLEAGQDTTRSGGHTFDEPGTYTIQFAVGEQARTLDVDVVDAGDGDNGDDQPTGELGISTEAAIAGGLGIVALVALVSG